MLLLLVVVVVVWEPLGAVLCQSSVSAAPASGTLLQASNGALQVQPAAVLVIVVIKDFWAPFLS